MAAVVFTAWVLPVFQDSYCRAIANWSRPSAPIVWSAPLDAASRSICTHLISPLNAFPRGP